MSIHRLCCCPGCTRFREEGSKYCSVHREKYEEADRQRYRDYLSRKMNRQHTKSPYSDLYATREWKELRIRHLEKFPYCEKCGTRYGLQVHHKYPEGVDYSSPEMFFNEDALETLCTSCHSKTHDENRKRR